MRFESDAKKTQYICTAFFRWQVMNAKARDVVGVDCQIELWGLCVHSQAGGLHYGQPSRVRACTHHIARPIFFRPSHAAQIAVFSVCHPDRIYGAVLGVGACERRFVIATEKIHAETGACEHIPNCSDFPASADVQATSRAVSRANRCFFRDTAILFDAARCCSQEIRTSAHHTSHPHHLNRSST